MLRLRTELLKPLSIAASSLSLLGRFALPRHAPPSNHFPRSIPSRADLRAVVSIAGNDLRKKQNEPKRGLDHVATETASHHSSGRGVCAAYCSDMAIPWRVLARYFSNPIVFQAASSSSTHALSRPAEFHPDAVDVLRVPVVLSNASENTSDKGAHALFFRSGAVVFWGVPMDIRRELFWRASSLAVHTDATSMDDGATALNAEVTGTHSHHPTTRPPAAAAAAFVAYDWNKAAGQSTPDSSTEAAAITSSVSNVRMEDFEHEFEFILDPTRRNGHATFKNDRIYIADLANIDEVIALSYGLAQSVKLHLSEVALDALVQRTQVLPKELAAHGRISLSATMIRKLIGELLSARYSVNLVSDILDTPEFFWQRPELERLHVECVSAVDLKQRSRILNARAEVINDTLHMLNAELAEASSLRLERAILFLIWIEVLFEVARFSGLTAQ